MLSDRSKPSHMLMPIDAKFMGYRWELGTMAQWFGYCGTMFSLHGISRNLLWNQGFGRTGGASGAAFRSGHPAPRGRGACTGRNLRAIVSFFAANPLRVNPDSGPPRRGCTTGRLSGPVTGCSRRWGTVAARAVAGQHAVRPA